MMHPSWIGKGTTVAQRLTRSQPDRARRDGVRPGLLDASPILSEGNARLEFFGDSILKVALSETVIKESGFGPGGGGGDGLKVRDMSVRRSMLENNELLGLVALKEWRIARGKDSEKSHICRICVPYVSHMCHINVV